MPVPGAAMTCALSSVKLLGRKFEKLAAVWAPVSMAVTATTVGQAAGK